MKHSGKITLAALALTALSACSNGTADEQGGGIFGALSQTARQAVAARNAPEEPATPPKSPAEAAAEALRVNPAPLIQAGFESLGRTQVMAMTGHDCASSALSSRNCSCPSGRSSSA